MNRLIAAILIAAAAPAIPAMAQTNRPALTDEEARLAAAREYIEASRIRDTINDSLRAVLDQTVTQMRSQMLKNVPADKEAAYERMFTRVMEILGERMINMTPELIEAQVQIAARIYTVQELRAITAFLRTREGQAMINKSKAYQLESSRVMNEKFLIPLVQDIPIIVKQIRQETEQSEQSPASVPAK